MFLVVVGGGSFVETESEREWYVKVELLLNYRKKRTPMGPFILIPVKNCQSKGFKKNYVEKKIYVHKT